METFCGKEKGDILFLGVDSRQKDVVDWFNLENNPERTPEKWTSNVEQSLSARQ